MLSLINCTTYQNFMRFYKMVRLLSLVKNPGMEPVGMILPLTTFHVYFLCQKQCCAFEKRKKTYIVFHKFSFFLHFHTLRYRPTVETLETSAVKAWNLHIVKMGKNSPFSILNTVYVPAFDGHILLLYWVPQKLPQICTVIVGICIGKVA